VQTSACSGPVTIGPVVPLNTASLVAGVAGLTDLRTQVTVGTATFVFTDVPITTPLLSCRYTGLGSTDTATEIQYLFYRNHDVANTNMMLVNFKALASGEMTVNGVDFGNHATNAANCAEAHVRWGQRSHPPSWGSYCSVEPCAHYSPGIKNIQLLTAPTCATCTIVSAPATFTPFVRLDTASVVPGVAGLTDLRTQVTVGTATYLYPPYDTSNPPLTGCRYTGAGAPNAANHVQYLFYRNHDSQNTNMMLVDFKALPTGEMTVQGFDYGNVQGTGVNAANCAEAHVRWSNKHTTGTNGWCNGDNGVCGDSYIGIKNIQFLTATTCAPPPPPPCATSIVSAPVTIASMVPVGAPMIVPGVIGLTDLRTQVTVGTATFKFFQQDIVNPPFTSCRYTGVGSTNTADHIQYLFYRNHDVFNTNMMLVDFRALPTGEMTVQGVDFGTFELSQNALNCVDAHDRWTHKIYSIWTPWCNAEPCGDYSPGIKNIQLLTAPTCAPPACGTFAQEARWLTRDPVPGVLVSSLDQVSVGSLTIVDRFGGGYAEVAADGICDDFQHGVTLINFSTDTRLSRQWLAYYNTATTTRMVIFWLAIDNGQLAITSWWSMQYTQGTTTNCADAKVRWEQGNQNTDYAAPTSRFNIKNVQIMCSTAPGSSPVVAPVVAPVYAPSSRPSSRPTHKPTPNPTSAPVLSPIVTADFVETIAKPLPGVLTVDLNLIRVTGGMFSYFQSPVIKTYNVAIEFCEVNNAPGFPNAPPTDAFNRYYMFYNVFGGVANLIYVRLELRAGDQVWISGKTATVYYSYGYTCKQAVTGWSTAKPPPAVPTPLNNVLPSTTAKGYSLNQIGFAWSSRSPTLAPVASVAPTYSLTPTYAPTYVPTPSPTLPKATTAFITATWVAIPAMSSITSLDQMSVKSLFMGGNGVTAAGKNLNAMVCRLPQAIPNTNLGRTFITAIRDGTTTKIASFKLKIENGKVWVRTPEESTGKTQTGNTFIVYSSGSTPYSLPSDCKTLIGYWNTMAQKPIATCNTCANFGVRAIEFTDARNGLVTDGIFKFFAGITGRRRLATTSVASMDADGSSQAIFKAVGAMLHVSPALMEMKAAEVDADGAVNVVVQFSAFLDDFSGVESLTDLLASLTATAYDKVYSGAFLTSLQALSPVGSFAKSIQQSAVEMSETFLQLSDMTQAPTFLPTAAPTFAPTEVPSFKPTKKLKTHKPSNPGSGKDTGSDTGSDMDGRRLRQR
jgi:hypothetical protein